MIAVLESVPEFGVMCPERPAFPALRRNRLPIAQSAPRPQVDACLQRVQDGDEEAARELMDRLYPLVLKLVRAYLPRRTSEEDLAQTVFMKIFSRLDQYSGAVPIEHWVSRITINTCLNELKAEKIRPEWRWADLSEEHQHVLETLTAVEDENAERAFDAKSLLKRLLAELNPKDRMVIQLLHIEEKSVSEIAAITGWSKPVIKVRAFRARKKLQDRLQTLETPAQRQRSVRYAPAKAAA